jgi:SulP family sulfate permease
VAVDILAAIFVGILVALLIFVYNYARLPVIRFEGSGATRRSPVDRTPEDEAILAKRGARIQVLGLQGYLFFGSVEKVIDAVRRRIAQNPPPEALVIDFHHVTGLDSAACAALLKLGLLGEGGRFRIALADVPDSLAEAMARWGIGTSERTVFRRYPNLAAALEDAEEDILVVHGRTQQGDIPLLDRLAPLIPRATDLLAQMERLQLLPGEVLIRAGGTEGDIFFIESGRVNVQLSNPAGPPTRLRSLRAGAIFGEAARYLGRKRTADVVVHAPSIIWRLSDAALDRMEAEDRDLAAMLHAVMARSLAEKVEKTNGMLTAALA